MHTSLYNNLGLPNIIGQLKTFFRTWLNFYKFSLAPKVQKTITEHFSQSYMNRLMTNCLL
jgi:hypothetical protein